MGAQLNASRSRHPHGCVPYTHGTLGFSVLSVMVGMENGGSRAGERNGDGSGLPGGQRLIEARHQFFPAEWFIEKPERTTSQCSLACLGFGEGRNKYDGQSRTSSFQPVLQFKAAHARHLHIGNKARRFTDAA